MPHNLAVTPPPGGEHPGVHSTRPRHATIGRATVPVPRDGRVGQKIRATTEAGAASKVSISSSSLTSVREAPAISSDVQYSPT